MALQTPILLIGFNRPLHTQKVLARIREVKPTRLFVVVDGARKNHETDAEKVQEVEQTIKSMVDWDCQLVTEFRKHNLGCGRGPAAAITWFFNQVGEGIILEDDCLPSLSFFTFCQLMLEKYRTEGKILAVSGYTFFGQWHPESYDYFYSDGGNWGWASWSRAWQLFDYEMASWPTLNDQQRAKVQAFYPGFDSLYQKIAVQHYDAWDIQWHYTRLLNDGLTVTPSKNLVQNIGFGNLATHTFDEKSELANYPSCEIDFSRPLRPPHAIENDTVYRQAIIKRFFESRPIKNSLVKRLYHGTKSAIKRMVK